MQEFHDLSFPFPEQGFQPPALMIIDTKTSSHGALAKILKIQSHQLATLGHAATRSHSPSASKVKFRVQECTSPRIVNTLLAKSP